MLKLLITCPPMINRIKEYHNELVNLGFDYTCPRFNQVMTESDLVKIIGNYDAWIIGDDPATEQVFKAGKEGKLRAAVKWGVGVDNVDFNACKKLDIPITNIPNSFGEEVSDVALGMLLNLTRKLHIIDKGVKEGKWIKPCCESLVGRKVCLVGFGDIGQKTARKLLSFKLNVYVRDPRFKLNSENKIDYSNKSDINFKIDECLQSVKLVNSLNEGLNNADYVIVTCSLNKQTYKLLNYKNLKNAKKGFKLINVSRGQVIVENDLIKLLDEGYLDSVGLDVFDVEPLPINSRLRDYEQNIFGTHNGSNSRDAVDRVSRKAINIISEYLFIN